MALSPARRFLGATLPAVLVASVLAGCGADVSGASGPHDVLLVTIDTLRPDFVGMYGHPRLATPRIDRLAATGVVFNRHYTVMAHTAPAHATMFCGLAPLEHGVRTNGARIGADVPLLAESFQAAGYRTAAVVAASILDERRGLSRGFEVYDDDLSKDAESVGRVKKQHQRDGSEVVDRALELLAADDGRPLFLWVHLYDPHEPYDPPPGYEVDARAARAVYASLAEPSEELDLDVIVDAMAAYEGEVRYTDAQVGRLLDAWDAREQARSSIVCVTSDHGEGLGEHGLIGHGLWNYEEQLLVPLVLRLPGYAFAGTQVLTPTSHLDLAATLSDLARVDILTPGRSLAVHLGEEQPRAGALIFAERRHYRPQDWERRQQLVRILENLDGAPGTGRGDQTAVIRDGWKYIWSEDSGDELYDLERDPRESNVVIDEHPDLADELRRLVEAWRAAAADRARGAELLTGDDIASELQHLGYLDAPEPDER
jgi:arylsulfatase A-like enzyme